MNASDHQEIRKLFDEYLQMYASRDDRLTTYFSDDFSGFTGGGDFLVNDRDEWVAITRQDFAQVKDSLRIDLKDLAIQSLSETIAVTTGFFNIHLPIKDHILSRETARLVLIFRKESTVWKISHSSISIPYHLVREGEIYPLQELVERNKTLESQVEERTAKLSAANEMLRKEIVIREDAEHKLQLSIERFKTLADATFEGIAITVQGRITDVNTRLAQILGFERHELIGMEVFDIIPPEVHSRVLANIKGGIESRFEHEMLRKDGSRIFVVVHSQEIKQNERNIRLTAIRDITERNKMETALLESEGLFRTLCNFAPIGIFQSDCTGSNVYMNPRWEEITGISAREGMDQGWIKAVHPDDRAEMSKLWLEATETGGNYAHECRLLTAQEETVWVRILASPLKGPDGSFAGFVGTVEDITKLLQIKQDMLKTEKLESLGVLAGGIAHDFNNILTAILGNISLARFQAKDPEKVTQRLEVAEKATIRAKELAQQLLTFAQGGDPVKKVIKLSSLLNEAVGFAMHGSDVKCKFALADELWPIEADEGQLSQVIHNLVLNAIQAMPNGGVITIVANNAETPSGGNKFVKISVADTGTGIPEDLLPKIFDPYFTTKQQGSGLGLASCFSIVRKHDGKIRVESTLGKGTTFHISLPATEKLEGTKPAACLEVVRGKGRVLVMDDEDMVREILKELLEELGYLVECTENGSEAVELYRKRQEEGTPFAAVIMDLTIPGGTGGKEAISSLIQIDPNIKAIVSSGYATNPIMANFREYGFSGVLSKPYRFQELNMILQDLLKD